MKKGAVGVGNLSMFDSARKSLSCVECEALDVALKCSLCEALQPLRESNPFLCFGFKEEFCLDSSELLSRYLKYQQEVHPDRYMGSSVRQQEYAHQHAAWANTAYGILKDPLLRAEYLLEKIAETPSLSLVEEIFDLREQLALCTCAKERGRFILEITKLYHMGMEKLESAFSEQHLLEAKLCLERLRYLTKIKQEAACIIETGA